MKANTYGDRWTAAMGLQDDKDDGVLEKHRLRFAHLKERLVFKIDGAGSTDPLTAFMMHQQSEEVDKELETSSIAPAAPATAAGSLHTGQVVDSSNSDDGAEDGDSEAKAGWAQYFTDENLVTEINTDLDRLYPTGKETFFQNDAYLSVLRNVLFVWCKLHPDVSYRQGMHDVAAVVMYAFLTASTFQVELPILTSPNNTPPSLPEHIEADVFMVFEAVMLYLKPFYEIVTVSLNDELENVTKTTNDDQGPRLFGNFSPKESGDSPADLFGTGVSSLFNDNVGVSNSSAGGDIECQTSSTAGRRPKPALHRLCEHVQHELLQQRNPQLYYHLKNLDIVPETYCLRWVRLLFAREFVLDDLLVVWDAMITDTRRDTIVFPDAVQEPSDDDLNVLPKLKRISSESRWMGFPLLRFLCVAKLLQISPKLRKADNTGCLRLLMHSGAGGVEIDDDDQVGADLSIERISQTMSLVNAARVLQDPMLEEDPSMLLSGLGVVDDELGIVEVTEFQSKSLGIVLTGARAPYENRLAVKNFAEDPSSPDGIGPAERSGKVRIGDMLQSINGVPIVGMTTEEAKRHIQLVGRPVFMGFRHCRNGNVLIEEANEGHENAPPREQPRDGLDAVSHHFLPGEMCYAHADTSLQQFTLSPDGSWLAHFISGKLYITNYRCFFTRLIGHGAIDWQVPVLAIGAIEGADILATSEIGDPHLTSINHTQAVLGYSRESMFKIVIRCKDTQVARLSFSNHTEYSKLVKCLSWLAFPSNLLDAFCFAYSPTVAPSDEGVFDLRQEYQRIGLLDFPDRLRCIDQSARYDLCDTYPQHLIVPIDISDVRLKTAAAFRAHNRLPVVSWIHRGNGATINRSSQPSVGLKSARSLEDELLVALLCTPNNRSAFGRYMIMDARSQLAAVGNKAMGKGTEIPGNYRGSKLAFMNIDNIHTIRQSLVSLATVFEPRPGMSDDSTSFYGRIENSGWLKHVRLVLKASVEMAHHVFNGISVLTHCSDGWDRTAQMVSLAELMLDPYYRTLRGFQVLIEKEWCSFGHQFATRCGHGRNDTNNDKRSPVFLLWLDCVWQYTRQFPTECEFNERLLLTLADHVYSCKFGTFMFDCERQR